MSTSIFNVASNQSLSGSCQFSAHRTWLSPYCDPMPARALDSSSSRTVANVRLVQHTAIGDLLQNPSPTTGQAPLHCTFPRNLRLLAQCRVSSTYHASIHNALHEDYVVTLPVGPFAKAEVRDHVPRIVRVDFSWRRTEDGAFSNVKRLPRQRRLTRHRVCNEDNVVWLSG
jgi:hypothetical protein